MKNFFTDCIAWLSVLAVWIISLFTLEFFLTDWIKKDPAILPVIFALSLLICLGYMYLVDYIELRLEELKKS
jgi:hypothetical protein